MQKQKLTKRQRKRLGAEWRAVIPEKPEIPKEDLELIDESLTFSAHLLMEKHRMKGSQAKRLIRERLNTQI